MPRDPLPVRAALMYAEWCVYHDNMNRFWRDRMVQARLGRYRAPKAMASVFTDMEAAARRQWLQTHRCRLTMLLRATAAGAYCIGRAKASCAGSLGTRSKACSEP